MFLFRRFYFLSYLFFTAWPDLLCVRPVRTDSMTADGGTGNMLTRSPRAMTHSEEARGLSHEKDLCGDESAPLRPLLRSSARRQRNGRQRRRQTLQTNDKRSISKVFMLCLRWVNHGVMSKVLLEAPRELNFQDALLNIFTLSFLKKEKKRVERILRLMRSARVKMQNTIMSLFF